MEYMWITNFFPREMNPYMTPDAIIRPLPKSVANPKQNRSDGRGAL
jgi:hypothetical protein